MSQDQIAEIELNITEAKKFVAEGKSLERLLSNRDFKKIVLEGYFEKEAVRLVHLKADHNMQSDDDQASILSQIDAIGNLTHYFRAIRHNANMAEKAIEEGEQGLDELRGEGAEE